MGASARVAASPFRQVRDADPRRALARSVERRITLAMFVAHTLGVIDLFALMFWVLPAPDGVDPGGHLEMNLIALGIYFPLAMALGLVMGHRISPARYPWILEGREPTAAEQASVIRMPMRCLRLDGSLWLGGLVLFTSLNLAHGTAVASHVGKSILLGGLTVCAVAYLLAERLNRPMVELALAGGPPVRPAWPGVEGRLVLAWVSATGIPLVGLVMLACHALMDPTVTRVEVARSAVVLGSVALLFGLGTMIAVARSVAQPLTALRRAVGRVEGGDLSRGVSVNDGSEVGTLQSGFNRLVERLRERERVEELYSRQVGQEVAREALEGEDPRLGGQVCETAVLFVDLVGSTEFAVRNPPERVVDLLNRFFAIVVDVVHSHGGWINKFEGDAALCVFGAPAELPDASGCALRAARSLDARLREELPEASAGIGVSAGPTVAGWVGAEKRFEYTVVGDPVNEAARLCELAKTQPSRLLASDAILERAEPEERERWRPGETTVLRGRTVPTRLAAPA